MSERLLDPIERGETRAESWAADHIIGDYFICQCGDCCKLDDGMPASADPFAPPVCPKCCPYDLATPDEQP